MKRNLNSLVIRETNVRYYSAHTRMAQWKTKRRWQRDGATGIFSELLVEAETGTFTKFVHTPTRRHSDSLSDRSVCKYSGKDTYRNIQRNNIPNSHTLEINSTPTNRWVDTYYCSHSKRQRGGTWVALTTARSTREGILYDLAYTKLNSR